ncbi:major facilitator superfamily domain-containing protein [Aspergillus pseudonomiae]|uniref:Major facilitator superfamily domain-containing protein n=1 Tax=Aspergillus pseudonomiae TaxID=1506151 RepID=A0A5N7CS91_9EURO|nr:major facilitator superfamily domain-containing protein [Aspergillus pseudonomiae]KAE8397071.1 major facilitator superfamily domain-containing protein [Aspergillus pseudonomiae]
MDSSNNDVGCRADRNDKGAATSSVSATRRAAEDLISPASASRNATEHIQRGVRNVEDVTSSWPRKALIAMFLLFYLFLFEVSLQQEVTTSLAPYVTSSFQLHSLTATTQMISGVIGGVSNLPVAKILDLWGRTEGFFLMTVLCTSGLIMMAACQNVQTFAAAQVLYWVGYNGLDYIINVFIADTTSLVNRSVILGISQTPYLATAFAGPRVAQLFLEHTNFRWAFGVFTITTPFFAAPIIILFLYYQRRSRSNTGETLCSDHGRLLAFWNHCKSLDIVGMTLLIAGFVLLLLPLNLAARAPDGWSTGYIIAMLVIGVVALVGFAVWEKWVAPTSLLPFNHLVDQSIIGACIVACAQFISFYCWASYFLSYLQVVKQMSIQNAGYVSDAYVLVSCFWAVVIGLLIQRFGQFKWLGMGGVPFMLLGTGLLIHFRTSQTSIGYVVMCQVFNGVAGSTLIATQRMAAQSSVGHENLAVITALIGLFSSLGAAIGSTLATAIWTNLMPHYLREYLPAADQKNLPIIYGSLVEQLQYPWGSPTRIAIVQAYTEVQRWLLAAGICFVPLIVVGIVMWKNVSVRGMSQTKGNIY